MLFVDGRLPVHVHSLFWKSTREKKHTHSPSVELEQELGVCRWCESDELGQPEVEGEKKTGEDVYYVQTKNQRSHRKKTQEEQKYLGMNGSNEDHSSQNMLSRMGEGEGGGIPRDHLLPSH